MAGNSPIIAAVEAVVVVMMVVVVIAPVPRHDHDAGSVAISRLISISGSISIAGIEAVVMVMMMVVMVIILGELDVLVRRRGRPRFVDRP